MESQETPEALQPVVAAPKTGRRSVKVGVVTSNKMTKTIVVSVERRVPHPLYRRIMARTSKFLAHDEKNSCSIGDTVSIVETRPLSKRKRWRLLKIIRKAS
ncbi:MAG: 30S ribosomal protein S17 [Acidimicrobiia bacterium]|nr:30S ribosomal protein S17 [Acidimicrobiia bacterium]